jgi:outer membrane protein OmpA-like peptidoglycan-associated protein
MVMERGNLPGGEGRTWARWAGALAAVAITLAPAVGRAQDSTFYLDRLRMAGAPDDGIGVWRPQMGKETRFFGQLGLGFALNPLRIDNYVDDLDKEEAIKARLGGNPVSAQLITYLDAGVEVLDRVAFQASFPLVVFEDGNRTDYGDLGIDERVNLKTVAPMDLRLDARVIVFRTEDRAFKLGIDAAVFLPTGNEFSFAGDTKTSGSFGVAAEYDLKQVFVTLNAGAAIRPEATLHELELGSELTYGVAAYAPLLDDRLRVGGEVFGSFGLRSFGELDASPIEWLLGGKTFFLESRALYAGFSAGTRLSGGYAPDFRAVAVFGGSFSVKDVDARAPDFKYEIAKEKDTDNDGYPDVIDLCPEDPEDGVAPKPSDGCPNMPDRDGDGVPDVVDKCVDVPEDLDNIDDRDGCPEDDADQDGVADAVDHCPKEPGEKSDDAEKNGCPQFVRRISGSAEIQIMKQIEFEFDRWVILPKSFPILDEVVRLLRANPEIKLLSIEGHTDNTGTPEYNDKLARNRALAVRNYLTNKGIASERLTSQGFGATRPLTGNDSAEGRARNRRVEFHIMKQTIEGR